MTAPSAPHATSADRGPWMQRAMSELEQMPTAVRTFTDEWSGAELLERAGGAARFLDRCGSPGRPIPALVGSTAAAYALTLGGAFSNHPIAPLGTRLAVAELAPLVKALGAPVLVADHDNAEIAGRTAAAAGTGVAIFDDVAPAEVDFVPTTPDSVVLVLHTSGTTGQPKMVSVRDAAMYHRAGAYRAEMGLGPGDLYCSAGAFNHTGGVGMCFVAAADGAGVVPLARFSVDAWRALAELEPTCGLLVPTMIDLLLEQGALGALRLRALHYGTAPIHPLTLRGALDALPATRFTQAYGQTEGGPLALLSHDDHLRALDGELELLASVGRAPAGVELRIEGMGDDRVGEVVARAAQVFQPAPDGWLHTGDLGRVDAEGYLYLQGRLGDTIIRGGENIYPLEVERVLERHPGVREAAVVGVPDRRWGETVMAFVVAADLDRPPDIAALTAHARDRLAAFKVPIDWQFATELPRSAGGKLLRHRLAPPGGFASFP
ncbi:MAG: class I adenylate-forming enzyme family protein [Acidimicrobiales bacterium]